MTALADLAAEDHGDLVGLPDRAIGVEQALTEFIECCAAIKDEIVTEFDLRENKRCWQPDCARSLVVKNGVRRANHFWPHATKSRGVSASASCWRRSGAAHLMKALAHCLKAMPSSRIRLASQ